MTFFFAEPNKFNNFCLQLLQVLESEKIELRTLESLSKKYLSLNGFRTDPSCVMISQVISTERKKYPQIETQKQYEVFYSEKVFLSDEIKTIFSNWMYTTTLNFLPKSKSKHSSHFLLSADASQITGGYTLITPSQEVITKTIPLAFSVEEKRCCRKTYHIQKKVSSILSLGAK